MFQFTCGSSLPLDYSSYDGVVAGYHLSLWDKPLLLDIPDKIYRAQFLYGNKHHKPCPRSGCDTIAQWVGRRVGKFPQIDEWVLVNEFTDDLGIPYPDYKLDDLKRYCEAAHLASPNARLIIGDFKPHLIKKWEAIALIVDKLKQCGFPVEAGIQTHFKTYNALVILTQLPIVIKHFDVPVHFIEASLWYSHLFDKLTCKNFWNYLIDIGEQNQVQSFCQWWLTPEDVEVGRRMPTFEKLNLYCTNYE